MNEDICELLVLDEVGGVYTYHIVAHALGGGYLEYLVRIDSVKEIVCEAIIFAPYNDTIH